MSGFGVVTGNAAQLRSYIDIGTGHQAYIGTVLSFAPCTQFVGWLRVPSVTHRLNLYFNGIQSNAAFNITQEGKQVNFSYKGDITQIKNNFVIQLEITEP